MYPGYTVCASIDGQANPARCGVWLFSTVFSRKLSTTTDLADLTGGGVNRSRTSVGKVSGRRMSVASKSILCLLFSVVLLLHWCITDNRLYHSTTDSSTSSTIVFPGITKQRAAEDWWAVYGAVCSRIMGLRWAPTMVMPQRDADVSRSFWLVLYVP